MTRASFRAMGIFEIAPSSISRLDWNEPSREGFVLGMRKSAGFSVREPVASASEPPGQPLRRAARATGSGSARRPSHRTARTGTCEGPLDVRSGTKSPSRALRRATSSWIKKSHPLSRNKKRIDLRLLSKTSLQKKGLSLRLAALGRQFRRSSSRSRRPLGKLW